MTSRIIAELEKKLNVRRSASDKLDCYIYPSTQASRVMWLPWCPCIRDKQRGGWDCSVSSSYNILKFWLGHTNLISCFTDHCCQKFGSVGRQKKKKSKIIKFDLWLHHHIMQHENENYCSANWPHVDHVSFPPPPFFFKLKKKKKKKIFLIQFFFGPAGPWNKNSNWCGLSFSFFIKTILKL